MPGDVPYDTVRRRGRWRPRPQQVLPPQDDGDIVGIAVDGRLAPVQAQLISGSVGPGTAAPGGDPIVPERLGPCSEAVRAVTADLAAAWQLAPAVFYLRVLRLPLVDPAGAQHLAPEGFSQSRTSPSATTPRAATNKLYVTVLLRTVMVGLRSPLIVVPIAYVLAYLMRFRFERREQPAAGPRAHLAVQRLPRAHLRLAHDPGHGGPAQRRAAPARAHRGAHHRAHLQPVGRDDHARRAAAPAVRCCPSGRRCPTSAGTTWRRPGPGLQRPAAPPHGDPADGPAGRRHGLRDRVRARRG